MSIDASIICPCQMNPTDGAVSLLSYKQCCQDYHDDINKINGVKADTAERLMRTRYSAFVLVKPDYIVKTTVLAQQALLDIQSIETWAKETDWAGLEILNHTPKIGKRHAQVEFKAYFNSSNNVQSHHELSAFVKVADKSIEGKNECWYFLDPTVAMNISQKQPCICGSGEKFKRCCGQFLP